VLSLVSCFVLAAKRILGMGNPLLDISAKVTDEYLAQ
jgi:hypothetical protein